MKSRQSGRKSAIAMALVMIVLLHAWALMALYYWFGGQGWMAAVVILGYLAGMGLLFRVAERKSHAAGTSLILVAAVAAWWSLRTPDPDLNLAYSRETEQLAVLQFEGSQLRVEGMRDFRYPAPDDVDARWASRTYDLGQLRAVDFIFTYGEANEYSPGIMLSFDFNESPPLAVAIAPRVEKGETFNLTAAFFKQYELCYLWGDEQDFLMESVLLRGAEVFLFRSSLTPDQGRRLLRELATKAHELHEEQPRFYSPVFTRPAFVFAVPVESVTGGSFPWYALLSSVRSCENRWLENGMLLPLASRESARINGRVQEGPSPPSFSGRIRSHLPAREDLAAPWEQPSFRGPQ